MPTAMQVTVTKITNYEMLRRAAAATVRNDCAGIDSLTMYVAQHSPIRSQIFEVQMDDIPVAYSTHLLRHNIGYDFQGALTHRDDRGGDGDAVVTRLTPTKHMMILNAQALINMARWRLCFKAHEITLPRREGPFLQVGDERRSSAFRRASFVAQCIA